MLLRRFAFVGLLSCSVIVWSVACSSEGDSDAGSKGNGDAGAAGAGQGSGSTGNGSGSTGSGTGGTILGSGGMGGDGFTGAGTGGFGSSIISGPDGGASCDCGGAACQCSDGKDNDAVDGEPSDGIDGLDIECTGACDNDEGSFATGIPGDNKDPHQDCFFDGDSGAGNDGCKDASDPSAECQNFCAPLTPNGCDCFGCCAVTLDNGETATVQLGGTCEDADDIGDETKCKPCTQSEACMNECGECELCPGKDPADIPESCNPDTGTGGSGSGTGGSGTGGTPNYTCDNGAVACTSSTQCGTSGYCQTGCCVKLVIK
jgi:hypothetical protein